jgi:hypothetical protein
MARWLQNFKILEFRWNDENRQYMDGNFYTPWTLWKPVVEELYDQLGLGFYNTYAFTET